jgi:hypothetical protein
VEITTPTEGASFAEGGDITIIASASDSDGTVNLVEFFEGANKLGEDSSGPDSRVTWTNVPAGNYTLTARATDNDGQTTTSGEVHITVNQAPTVSCLEDDDSRIAYSNGWHLGNDPNASAGHFRYNTGKDPKDHVRVEFDVPAGQTGKITYYFARSTRKGTADIYLDGTFRMTLNYQGSSGSMQHPEFSGASQVSLNELSSGRHTLELRNLRDVVFVDRFCLESASSNAQPLVGPGNTTDGNQTVGGGQTATTNYMMQPGAQEVSIVAESNLAIPFQLVLVDPSGLTLQTASSSAGLATINSPVNKGGVYLVRVVNLGLGPLQITTATTPLVNR